MEVRARTVVATQAAVVALFFSACARPASSKVVSPPPSVSHSPAFPTAGTGGAGSYQMTPAQLARTDRVVAVFETNEADGFAYIKALHDAGGYTCGSYALTTAHGEVLEVVKRWATLHPGSPLAVSLPILTKLAPTDSDDTAALDAAGFPAAWKQEAVKPEFIQVYRSVFHDLIAFPAQQRMASFGATSVLAECVGKNLFNLHGFSDDYDGGDAILARANAKAGGTPASRAISEDRWLGFVIDEMKADESNPHATNPGLADAMRAGAIRGDVLRSWLGNLALNPPLDTLQYGIVIEN